MTVNQIRQKYLVFFAQHGHSVVPSAPLVPENDPTTLFTGSGMQPMVPYLLGEKHPKGTRIADSQKCFRSQDIEEVGDNRHTTFFEMLGNWSLGDYFKKDQLRWFFTFLTQEVDLKPERLFVTVFRGSEELNIPRDDESVAIWKELFKGKGIEAEDADWAERDGMQGGRIFYYDEKKNWWSRSGVPANMPAGEPGGPDSEVFYDFGAELKLHENSPFAAEPCHVNCDCGRFLEIGNSVFMQYQKQPDGSFTELPQRNVDFGGGLERIAAVSINELDVFKTDIFQPLIKEIESLTGQSYEGDRTAQMRIIADHLRAAVFLIKDGVVPSNKGQGYFLRRLIRRATVKLHQLGSGLESNKLAQIADKGVLEIYDGIYFDRHQDTELVERVLSDEAQKFTKSLDKGLKFFEKQSIVTGKTAFDLYQTYGFPLEITLELAQQKGHQVNVDEFKEEFSKHQALSRSSSAGMFKGGLADQSEQTTKYHTATHLLHAALRQVLGKHVQQKGSNITVERLRFDFSHHQAVTKEEIQRVEDQVNEWIEANLPVTKQILPKQAALESGAVAFFVEKYPDEVSVYTIGQDSEADWISKEFCGGPHVSLTGEIGQIKIIKEQAVSAGVRRIYIQ
jgi:alanyl-tRNA synthetase